MRNAFQEKRLFFARKFSSPQKCIVSTLLLVQPFIRRIAITWMTWAWCWLCAEFKTRKWQSWKCVYCPKSGFLLTTLILTLFFIKNRFCCKRKMFKNKILNVTHNDYYDHDEAHQTTCSIIFQLCAEKIQIESAASIFMYIILFLEYIKLRKRNLLSCFLRKQKFILWVLTI